MEDYDAKQVHKLMKVHSNDIRAQKISSYSRTDYCRHVMKKKKERYLLEIEQVHKSQDDQHHVYIRTLHESQQNQHILYTFCHQSPCIKKQNHGMERLNGKAYASATKALIRSLVDPKLKPHQVKPVVFNGEAGQGHGLRIKGYQCQSTPKLQ
ncbi:hypothetical protein BC941DRAFT_467873 [Chlamydoabsidia padenii]|nr:hypothetical protein BC941DRAFT_467873 [Chlamydoabsidia padenii]